MTNGNSQKIASEIIDAILAYGDARADKDLVKGTASLKKSIELIRSALSVCADGGKDSTPTAEEVYRHILKQNGQAAKRTSPESICDVFEAIAAMKAQDAASNPSDKQEGLTQCGDCHDEVECAWHQQCQQAPVIIWRAIAEEAECVIQRGKKYLMFTEEMCIRLGTAIENGAKGESK